MMGVGRNQENEGRACGKGQSVGKPVNAVTRGLKPIREEQPLGLKDEGKQKRPGGEGDEDSGRAGIES